MKTEKASNQEVQDDHFGQKVQYGDRILLRHTFTDLFLQVQPTELTAQEGMVALALNELSTKSIFRFIPSQDIKSFTSELVIHGTNLSKFNLQVGGQINLQDAFYLLNSELGANYYVNVDYRPANEKGGQFKNLVFDAGLIPTHMRAKLWMAAKDNLQVKLAHQSKGQAISAREQHLKEIVYSGDIIRLRNQETRCCLQTQYSQSNKSHLVDEYPKFLQRQIKRLQDLPEDYDHIVDDEDQFDVDLDDIEDEEKLHSSSAILQIGIDMDKKWQSITNSCWEIQQVKALAGHHVMINGIYRFKHISSERYLGLDNEGQVNLVLKSRSPRQYADTLFYLRPMSQE